MKKDVLISISGRQVFADGREDDPIELVTGGRFYKRNGGYYIAYRESELTGLGRTMTVIKAEPSRVTLSRYGECPSSFVFEKGRPEAAFYHAGGYSLTLCYTTHLLSNTLTDEGGGLEVGYLVTVDGEASGSSFFTVDVKERPTAPC